MAGSARRRPVEHADRRRRGSHLCFQDLGLGAAGDRGLLGQGLETPRARRGGPPGGWRAEKGGWDEDSDEGVVEGEGEDGWMKMPFDGEVRQKYFCNRFAYSEILFISILPEVARHFSSGSRVLATVPGPAFHLLVLTLSCFVAQVVFDCFPPDHPGGLPTLR